MPITTEPSATADGEHIFAFGPFRLLAAQRLLLEGDTPVRLGSRAFDILAALVERSGEVVAKQELIARAWPQTFVEETNLKMQVSALRRALGDGQGGHRYVATVPGRGYNFVAPVHRDEPVRAALRPAVALAHNLPLAATRMSGREEAVAALVSRPSRQRRATAPRPRAQPRAARARGRALTPPRAARQRAGLVWTDSRRGGCQSRGAAVHRACHRDCRGLRADRCERPADRRDLSEARRVAFGDRVRRAPRRGAWGRRPCRRPRPQLAAVDGAASHDVAAASDDAGRRRMELRPAERG